MLVALDLTEARLWTGFFCFDNGRSRVIICSVVADFICFLIEKMRKFEG
jgi:hypothetical protein